MTISATLAQGTGLTELCCALCLMLPFPRGGGEDVKEDEEDEERIAVLLWSFFCAGHSSKHFTHINT